RSAVSIDLRVLSRRGVGDAVGAWEEAVEVIEAPVLRVDDHDVLDGGQAARGTPGRRDAARDEQGEDDQDDGGPSGANRHASLYTPKAPRDLSEKISRGAPARPGTLPRKPGRASATSARKSRAVLLHGRARYPESRDVQARPQRENLARCSCTAGHVPRKPGRASATSARKSRAVLLHGRPRTPNPGTCKRDPSDETSLGAPRWHRTG